MRDVTHVEVIALDREHVANLIYLYIYITKTPYIMASTIQPKIQFQWNFFRQPKISLSTSNQEFCSFQSNGFLSVHVLKTRHKGNPNPHGSKSNFNVEACMTPGYVHDYLYTLPHIEIAIIIAIARYVSHYNWSVDITSTSTCELYMRYTSGRALAIGISKADPLIRNPSSTLSVWAAIKFSWPGACVSFLELVWLLSPCGTGKFDNSYECTTASPVYVEAAYWLSTNKCQFKGTRN